MDFIIRECFKRSVTVEIINDSIVYAENEYKVTLNGKECLRGKENVFSIHGLKPDNEYSISVEDITGKSEKSFKTQRETVLLDIRDFGAKGDGKTNNTGFIQAAVMSCPDNGTVLIPEGVFLTGPVFLKSNMTLYLEKEAVLLGDPDRTHYPMLPGKTEAEEEYILSTWEGEPETSFASLITAVNVENTDITGEGTIDGNAPSSDWWTDPKKKRTAWRPNTIFLERCKNIRLQSVTVKNSPSWTVHPFYTDHIRVLNLTIWNPSDSPNTDGFDPESCRDILILGTRISVGDDCIAIKSGKYYMSKNHHRTAEGFTIRNSILERGHGSVTVGSEAAAGCRDVTVDRCIFDSTDRGLRIKTRRGRGPLAIYDDIYFHDIIMKNVHMPFTVNMFYFCDPDGHSDYVQDQSMRPIDERTPVIASIRAENISCTDMDQCFLVAYGLPESPIGEIILRNIRASFLPDAERTEKETIMMDNFPRFSGKGIFAGNVKKLTVENVYVEGASEKEAELKNVEEKHFDNVKFL